MIDRERENYDEEGFHFLETEKWRCGECDEIMIDDARVEAGMKCGNCAYGNYYNIERDEENDRRE